MKHPLKIKFNHTSLKAHTFQKSLLKVIINVVKSGTFLEGEENELLKRNLARYISARYCQTLASGHDALVLALFSIGIKKGDHVLFPVNAYPTAFAIFQTGAVLAPVDVDKNGQMDPDSLIKHISKKTKAVIVVHMYGQIGNLKKISAITKKYSLALIEDCAQSYGAIYQEKKVGTIGQIGCLSFYPTKNLGTLGDGGAIVTNSKKIYDYITRAKSYGEKNKYLSDFPSFHSRLPEIQAAVLNVYSSNIADDLASRRSLFTYFEEHIAESGLQNTVRVLKSAKQAQPAPHLFVVEVLKRNELQKYLSKRGIPTHIHYPRPVHKIRAFGLQNNKYPSYPTAELLSGKILSLPFHPVLTHRQIEYIVDNIKKFYLG